MVRYREKVLFTVHRHTALMEFISSALIGWLQLA